MKTSSLWGQGGELWDPRGRLPDFSYAGYRCGESPLPDVPAVANVRDFGAKGDGENDDTAAFLEAIATAPQGAITIPPGRYVLTDWLTINRSGLVLQGAGTDQTTLYCPHPLQELRPNWGATTGGRPTSNYSWSGGFVRFVGSFGSDDLTAIVEKATRGETTVRVSDPSGLQVGQRIEVFVSDTADNTLAEQLYENDPGDTSKLHGSTTARLVCRIVSLEGDCVTFDRPLRFALRPEWTPRLRRFAPTVTESGIEHLCFEFPVTPYEGHFTEPGYNAVAFRDAADCWARNLRIVNADSGLFPEGRFCTLQDIVFESSRPLDPVSNCTGHHGVYFGSDDNRMSGFDFRTRFIHDISVSHCAGNVIADGRGVDLCFDHHKRAPYENLFTDIDAGKGSHLWHCGGGDALGKNCAARGTFWNIRAVQPQSYPPASFGPSAMNLVAVETDALGETTPDGRWFETIPPTELTPQNLHAAQLARRLES